MDGTKVTVEFDGRLDAGDGAQSAEALAKVLDVGPVDVVWDLRKMTGYDAEARVAWQKALWPRREQIRGVVVMGGGPLVRVGAMTLAGLLSVPIEFLDA
jgi:hypothetical protein